MTDIKDRQFIGDRIRKRRREMGLSQEGLAELVGISYQQVQRYENGKSQIGTEKLQILAQSLQVPTTYFFGDEKEVVAESAVQCISADEAKFLKYFRKILRKDYKRSIMIFLKLAAEKED